MEESKYNFAKHLLDSGFVFGKISSKDEYDYRDNWYGASIQHPDKFLDMGDKTCYISVGGMGSLMYCFDKEKGLPEWWDNTVRVIVFTKGEERKVVGKWINEAPPRDAVNEFINM